MTLTAKQQRFVDEYLIDLNGTQAAIRAGYSEKTAEQGAVQLLRNTKVRLAVDTAIAERAKRTGVTADRVIQELSRLAFSDLRKVLDGDGNLKSPQQWDDDAAAAISSIEVVTKPGETDSDGSRSVLGVSKIKVWDKNSALEKLGKHLGLYVDRHEVTGKDGKDLMPQDNRQIARKILHILSAQTLEGE